MESNPWRSRIFERFPDSPYPLAVFQEGIIPAASLWTGSRLWVSAFREAGFQPGDRLVLCLPPSAEFLQVLLAAFWEGLTLAVAPPEADLGTLLETLDARAAVHARSGAFVWTAEGCSGPEHPLPSLRQADGPPIPDARLLMQTSGTSGQARWVAMSDRNILAVLDSHLPALDLTEARVLSVLPWRHSFGLILDLLPALFAGAEIVREPSGGRSVASMVEWMSEFQTTHFSAVPLTVSRLAETERGRDCLRRLRGGVVGGAPVSDTLAQFLQTTNMRPGYGQTEACPGVTLGEPGVWRAGALGHPIGCRVNCSERGELRFQGDNACLGFWERGRLRRLRPDRWVATGDLVRQNDDGYTFVARRGDRFKLANGRWVEAGLWESQIKSLFPQIAEALLTTPDNESLTLLVTLHPETHLPPRDILLNHLGGAARWIGRIMETPAAAWVYTPKGAVAREATAAQAASTFNSSLPHGSYLHHARHGDGMKRAAR